MFIRETISWMNKTVRIIKRFSELFTFQNPSIISNFVFAITIFMISINREFLSIAEALQMMQDPSVAEKILPKYGYQFKKNYEIYRVNKYKAMFYKNCTLPKQTSTGAYLDLPKAQKKGTSSYVAISENVEIGVYNNKAYENLVNQILGTPGFTLAHDGYEQEYSNGTYSIYTYNPMRRIRIEKTL